MTRTRCPGCGTVFRVSDEQLALREGMVRCGRCRTAFDAVTHALRASADADDPVASSGAAAVAGKRSAEDENAAGRSAAPDGGSIAAAEEGAPEPGPAFEGTSADEPAPTAEPTGTGEPEDTPEPQAATESPATPATAATREGEATSDSATTSLAQGTSDAEPLSLASAQDTAGSRADDSVSSHERTGSRLTALGLAALVLLALLQSLWLFHDALALRLPATKPALESLCGLLGCRVDLPSDPDLVSIEASELQPRAGAKDQLELRATLRNMAAFAQQFPHLELTLTDARDRAVGRRVFAPSDYLPPDQATAGFRPQSEQAVHLVIQAADLGASGYRIYAFYP